MSGADQLPLPLGTPPRLHSAYVVAFGRAAVCRLDGSAGPLIARLPASPFPSDTDPCPCEHRARCVAAVGLGPDGRPVPDGCESAEGWRAAERAYAEVAGP